MLLEEIVIKGKLEDINVDIARVVKLLLYKSNFNIKCGFPEIIKEGKTNNLVLMVNERVCILSFLCTETFLRVMCGEYCRTWSSELLSIELKDYFVIRREIKKKVWPGHFNCTNLKMLTQFSLCKYQNTKNSLMCVCVFFFCSRPLSISYTLTLSLFFLITLTTFCSPQPSLSLTFTPALPLWKLRSDKP